jgi:hypothetical protein
VFEHRFALGHERSHARLLVLGGERRMEQAPLASQAPVACRRARDAVRALSGLGIQQAMSKAWLFFFKELAGPGPFS